MEILLNFCQTTSSHIVEHIHEWNWWRVKCNINISLGVLLDWFFKSLPPITKYLAATCLANEFEAIQKAQHFDLIHTKKRFLYTFLLKAPDVVH